MCDEGGRQSSCHAISPDYRPDSIGRMERMSMSVLAKLRVFFHCTLRLHRLASYYCPMDQSTTWFCYDCDLA